MLLDILNKRKESSRKTRVELQKGKPFFLLHSWYPLSYSCMESVPITTKVVGSIPTQGEVYNIMW
jgi:hypothetical protein